MRILKLTNPRMKGEDVRQWQKFLISRAINLGVHGADGDFGSLSDSGTRLWQRRAGLKDDGQVGPITVSKARQYGFAGDKPVVIKVPDNPTLVNPSLPTNSTNWPGKPNFSYLNDDKRAALFGTFQFTPPPRSSSAGGNITILGNWESQNIVTVHIPQLKGVPLYSETSSTKSSGNLRFHKKAAKQLQDLFKAWEDAGLLHLILTYDGAYNPRYVRGSKVSLSNHCWGTALDINAPWNGLGKTPAAVGAKGSVRELVPLAYKYGFYWGGLFSRGDGMHFEVAFIP